jgi:hypothetical protein
MTDFSNQDLAGLDLRGQTLFHPNFKGAKLAGAFFDGTKLIGPKWEGADFVGADLSKAIIRALQMDVAGWKVSVYRNGTIRVGKCVLRTAEQWAEMGAADIAELTPEPDAPEDFIAERDAVLAASMALRGLY